MNSRPRWWSGGLAGAVSQSIVAPFDLLETRLVYEKKHYSLLQSASYAIRKHGKQNSHSNLFKYIHISPMIYTIFFLGFISLFDGLSAQILRQLTYTTLRFYLYSRGREDKFTFKQKIFLATFSGIVSSSVGIPMELINTRMQMDRVIKDKYKRKYRNVFHGLYRVWKDEGVTGLYTGGSYSLARGALMAIGQNAVYDHVSLRSSALISNDNELNNTPPRLRLYTWTVIT